MKKLFFAAIMLFIVSITMAQKTKPTDIVGVWAAMDKSFKLDMFNDGEEYKAHLLYAKKLVEAIVKH